MFHSCATDLNVFRSLPANSAEFVDGDSVRLGRAGPQQADPAGKRPAGSLRTARPQAAARPSLAKQPDWMPRIWIGCDFFAWFRLLVRNRFVVHPRCWCAAVTITVV